MKSLIKNTLRRFGYQISPIVPWDPNSWPAFVNDLSELEKGIIATVKPFTMTSPERLLTLIAAVSHIVKNQIPGDIVECGVWRGGSMMAVARTLLDLGDTSRRLYLYDTFAGMSEPTERDRDFTGHLAQTLLEKHTPNTGLWAYASLDEVRRNVLSTGYPEDKITFVKGKVEDTIPEVIPQSMALLRLDTDWYESTRHELLHLYPVLNRLGLLILDDYGDWQGAREAADEFLTSLPEPLYLHRIDNSGRIAVKI